MAMNRGKRSLTLDLARPEGRAVIHRLMPGFDVVVMNFREGVARRIEIDYATLSRFRPDLIYVAITGFGVFEKTIAGVEHDAFRLQLADEGGRGGAKAVIGEAEHVQLSERDSFRVLDLLEHPPKPNLKLRAAARALPRRS